MSTLQEKNEVLLKQLQYMEQLANSRKLSLDLSNKLIETLRSKNDDLLKEIARVKQKFLDMKDKRDMLKAEKKQLEVKNIRLTDDFIEVGRKNKLANKLMETANQKKDEVIQLNITLKQERESLKEQNAKLKILVDEAYGPLDETDETDQDGNAVDYSRQLSRKRRRKKDPIDRVKLANEVKRLASIVSINADGASNK